MNKPLKNLIVNKPNKKNYIHGDISKKIEDEVVLTVLQASKEPSLSGNLKDLAKKFK